MYKKRAFFTCLLFLTLSCSHSPLSKGYSRDNYGSKDYSKGKSGSRDNSKSTSDYDTQTTYPDTQTTTPNDNPINKAKINLDFENASVQSAKKRTNDKLLSKSASGKKSRFMIGYGQGSGRPSDRIAKITSDPTNPNNHVLHYWLSNAVSPGQRKGSSKGRMQLNIDKINYTEYFQRNRIYLHPDLELYRSYPKSNTWFTIMELWFGKPNQSNRFRITVNIAKEPGAGKPLLFYVSGSTREGGRHGHGKWKNIWEKVNYDFNIPTGQWLDVEFGYKQGNKSTGRFFMSIKKQNDSTRRTLFNITDWTYNPKAPTPVPLTMINPLKIYTSSRIIDYIRKHGGRTQVYWDDLKVWDKWIY